jgi:uncharacterized protein YcgL (UPF0745 family)
MTILDEILREEYDRLARGIYLIREELAGLPKGYISEKKIGNGTYYYLQKRENNKIVSKHIKKDAIEPYKTLIQHRKNLNQKVKELKAEQEKIAAALKKAKNDE